MNSTRRVLGACGVFVFLSAIAVAAAQPNSRERTKGAAPRAPTASRSTVQSKAAPAPQRSAAMPQRSAPARATHPQKSASSPRNAVAPRVSRAPSYRGPSVASNSNRSAPQVSQSSRDRQPRDISSPTVSRAPLIRAPQPAASDMPRTKAPATVSQPSQLGNDRPPLYSAGPVNRSDNDLRVRLDDDRFAGLIHIGTHRGSVGGVGGLYGRAHGIYGRRFCPPYGYGHYYYNYRPIYYPGYPYYTPWYGYSYTTVYLSEPYVVRVYDDTPDYVVSAYDTTPTTAAPVATQPAVSGPPPSSTPSPYQPLTAPQTPTPVEEGNAAFAAGRYDDARRLYSRAVLTDERDGYAKVLYAWSNFALGDYDVAATAIRRALLTTPDLMDYPLDVRTLYPERAVLDGHTDSLLRFLGDHPAHGEAQLVWGYLLYSIGQAEPAASVFNGLAGADQNDNLLSLLRDAAVRNARGPSPPPAP